MVLKVVGSTPNWRRIASELGAQVLATRARDLLRFRAGELPAGSEFADKWVAVGIDGGRVRIRTIVKNVRIKGKKNRKKFRIEWREPKVVILFETGVIPKSVHAALRLDCFLVDGCVESSSSSSIAFNTARHSGGVQCQFVRRFLAIALRVCSTISSHQGHRMLKSTIE